MDRRQFMRTSVAAAVAASVPAYADWEDVLYRPTKVESDLNAIRLDGSSVTLAKAQVQELSDSLKGKLYVGGPEYDESRLLLSASFDKKPAMVIRPSGPADVSSAVRFAAENDLITAVKCGGHSASGKSSCDGGMQIDLMNMRGVYVDPIAKTARVDGGSLLGELDHEAMAHGLVTTAGTVSHTGVGGLTLGGGFGRVGRKYGLTLDNVLEFDVVTPDGVLRRASPDSNPDLYWALRGGGGNFGIVTSFLFQLHPMQRQVLSGAVVYPMAQAKDVLRLFADYSEQAPDELHVGMFMGGGGDSEQPPAVGISVVYCGGDASKAEKLLAPLEKAGNMLVNTIKPIDYVALQRSGDWDDIRSMEGYMKTGFTGEWNDKLIDDLVDGFEVSPDRGTFVATQQSGGAIGRVGNDETAFAHRESHHNLLYFMSWDADKDGEAHVAKIKSHWGDIEPHTQGFYANDLFDQDSAALNGAYRGNFERLLKIKKQYDPSNLFRLNTNIRSS